MITSTSILSSLSIFAAALLLCTTCAEELQQAAEQQAVYSYGVSFPMLGNETICSTNYPWLPHNVDPNRNPTPPEYKDMPLQVLGDRQAFYNNYIDGCKKYWDENGGEGHLCKEYEAQRLDHNTDQIPSMVNFTDIGYKKIRAPEHVFELLVEFWEANKDKQSDESFFPGNVFINYWETETGFVDVANADLEGGGDDLMDELWKSSVDTISEWTGQQLVPSSLYGIRVYKEGAVLSTHVDRMPLISSAIINVAQDPDAEPWPLEVIGHDGVARNITVSLKCISLISISIVLIMKQISLLIITFIDMIYKDGSW
jgi:hypothetical protein